MRIALYLILIVIIAAIIWAALAFRGGSEKPTSSPTPSTSSSISIKNLAFDPATTTIASGTTVTWVNNDSVDHQIASDMGAFTSQPLRPGDKFEFTFSENGDFPYHCPIHPEMKGDIKVE